MTAKRLEFYPS